MPLSRTESQSLVFLHTTKKGRTEWNGGVICYWKRWDSIHFGKWIGRTIFLPQVWARGVATPWQKSQTRYRASSFLAWTVSPSEVTLGDSRSIGLRAAEMLHTFRQNTTWRDGDWGLASLRSREPSVYLEACGALSRELRWWSISNWIFRIHLQLIRIPD